MYICSIDTFAQHVYHYIYIYILSINKCLLWLFIYTWSYLMLFRGFEFLGSCGYACCAYIVFYDIYIYIILSLLLLYMYIYIDVSRGKELKSSTWLLFSHVQQAAVRHMSAGGAVGQTRSAHETKGTWTEERKDSESPYFLVNSSNFVGILDLSSKWSWAWCMPNESWRIWWPTSMLRSLHQAFWRCEKKELKQNTRNIWWVMESWVGFRGGFNYIYIIYWICSTMF